MGGPRGGGTFLLGELLGRLVPATVREGVDAGEALGAQLAEEITPPALAERGPTGEALGEQPASSQPGATAGVPLGRDAVVLARCNEDVKWAKAAVAKANEAGGSVELFVYQSCHPNEKHYVEANTGAETTKYIAYILEHFHELPDHVLFLHAHNDYGRHRTRFGEDVVSDPTWRTLDRFAVPQNTMMHVERGHRYKVKVWKKGKWAAAPMRITNFVYWLWQWNPVERSETLPTPENRFRLSRFVPDSWDTYCCSEFAVSRDVLRSRSSKLYRHIYERLKNVDEACHDTGKLREDMLGPISSAMCAHRGNAGELSKRSVMGQEVMWAPILGLKPLPCDVNVSKVCPDGHEQATAADRGGQQRLDVQPAHLRLPRPLSSKTTEK